MKYLLIILVLTLSSCAKVTTVNDKDSNVAIANAHSNCSSSYYASRAAGINKMTNSTEVQLFLAIEKLGGEFDPCPGFTNSYDAEIVYNKELTKRIEAALDLGKTTVMWAGRIWMMDIAVDGIVKLTDQSGTTVEVGGDFIGGDATSTISEVPLVD